MIEEKIIKELTEKIIEIKGDASPYEFIAACANAKAYTENKLQADAMKKTIEMSFASVIKGMRQ